MANDEYRAPLETARQLGLEVRNAIRRERAIRREVAEEIAKACAERARLANRIPEPHRSGVREGMIVAWIAAEKLAREIGTREGTDG